MKKQTQEQWIVERLEKTGTVSRNECLRNYISRLGARIADLKESGMQIEGGYVKTKNGKDFVYKIIK